MLPPLLDAARMWRSKELFGITQRLKAIGMLFIVRYMKVYYRIRVLVAPPGTWEARK
jgi:hypothetical protein